MLGVGKSYLYTAKTKGITKVYNNNDLTNGKIVGYFGPDVDLIIFERRDYEWTGTAQNSKKISGDWMLATRLQAEKNIEDIVGLIKTSDLKNIKKNNYIYNYYAAIAALSILYINK